jgi:hypothetical protein
MAKRPPGAVSLRDRWAATDDDMDAVVLLEEGDGTLPEPEPGPSEPKVPAPRTPAPRRIKGGSKRPR